MGEQDGILVKDRLTRRGQYSIIYIVIINPNTMGIGAPTAELEESSSVIELVGDKRPVIEEHLQRYRVRLAQQQAEGAPPGDVAHDPYKAPEQVMVGNIPNYMLGTVYKIAVCEELLRKGRVDKRELIEKLRTEHGGFDAFRFRNTFEVIKAYAEGREEDLAHMRR